MEPLFIVPNSFIIAVGMQRLYYTTAYMRKAIVFYIFYYTDRQIVTYVILAKRSQHPSAFLMTKTPNSYNKIIGSKNVQTVPNERFGGRVKSGILLEFSGNGTSGTGFINDIALSRYN